MSNNFITFTAIMLYIIFFQNVSYSEQKLNDMLSSSISTGVSDQDISDCFTDIKTFAVSNTLGFGDTLFLCIIKTNITEAIKEMNCLDMSITELGRFIEGIDVFVTCSDIDGKYHCIPEIYKMKNKTIAIQADHLNTGESRTTSYPIELPTLEGMNHSFWKQIYNILPEKEVECFLHVKIPFKYFVTYDINDPAQKQQNNSVVFSHKIILRQRPQKEMDMLHQWLRNTQPSLLPPIHEQGINPDIWYHEVYDTFEKTGYHQSGKNFISINHKNYNPWLFIRETNRKPPADLCPTTSQGWLELEKKFVPSTMRDEIHLTRILLEYLESKFETQIKKRNELVQWLQSLPEPQRVCMASNLEANWFMYKDDMPITKPYLELLKAVYPTMTLYHQRRCKYYIPELPAPVGWRPPPRSLEEVVKPTETDLALRAAGKEPEDGFRVWKTYPAAGGEYLFVAKFESVQDYGDIGLKGRDGFTFYIDPAQLDIADIIHIEQTYPGKLPQEDYREWNGEAEGLPVTATYFGLSAGNVMMKKKGEYKSLGFEFNKLSNEDQLYVQSRQKNPREFLEREWTVIYVDGESAHKMAGKFISADEEFVTLADYVSAKRVLKLSNISEKDRDYVRLCKNVSEKTFSPAITNDQSPEPPSTSPSETSEKSNLSADIASSTQNNEKLSTNRSTTLPDDSSVTPPPSQDNSRGWIIVPVILLLFFLIIIGLYTTKFKNNEK